MKQQNNNAFVITRSAFCDEAIYCKSTLKISSAELAKNARLLLPTNNFGITMTQKKHVGNKADNQLIFLNN